MRDVRSSIKKTIYLFEKHHGNHDFTAETRLWHIMYMHVKRDEGCHGVALLRSKKDGKMFLAVHRISREHWEIMEIVEPEG